MQVRAKGISGITAQSDNLPGLDDIFARFGDNLYFPCLLFVLQVFHPAGYVAHKSTEVAVDCFIPVIICHIEHIARTMSDTDTRNVSVGQRPHGFTNGAARLEVESTVEMIGTYFTEITGEHNREIERRSERCLRLHIPTRLRIGLHSPCKQYKG